MIQKASSACSTYRVHAEVDRNAIPKDNDLTILPSNLNDGLDIRNIMEGSDSLSSNLILHHIGPHHHPSQVSGTSCRPYPCNGNTLEPLSYLG